MKLTRKKFLKTSAYLIGSILLPGFVSCELYEDRKYENKSDNPLLDLDNYELVGVPKEDAEPVQQELTREEDVKPEEEIIEEPVIEKPVIMSHNHILIIETFKEHENLDAVENYFRRFENCTVYERIDKVNKEDRDIVINKLYDRIDEINENIENN